MRQFYYKVIIALSLNSLGPIAAIADTDRKFYFLNTSLSFPKDLKINFDFIRIFESSQSEPLLMGLDKKQGESGTETFEVFSVEEGKDRLLGSFKVSPGPALVADIQIFFSIGESRRLKIPLRAGLTEIKISNKGKVAFSGSILSICANKIYNYHKEKNSSYRLAKLKELVDLRPPSKIGAIAFLRESAEALKDCGSLSSREQEFCREDAKFVRLVLEIQSEAIKSALK